MWKHRCTLNVNIRVHFPSIAFVRCSTQRRVFTIIYTLYILDFDWGLFDCHLLHKKGRNYVIILNT